MIKNLRTLCYICALATMYFFYNQSNLSVHFKIADIKRIYKEWYIIVKQ